jgi:D-arabinose 1-dehydrogenase-like Zn-dependent alcohol dehydrogenase
MTKNTTQGDTNKPRTKVTRSTAGMRDVLFDTMERFLNGEVDANHVGAINKSVHTICQTVAMDLAAQKMLSDMKKSGELVPPGTPKSVADLNLNLMLIDRSKTA